EGRRPFGLTPEQTAVAPDDEHDRNRIRAREMLRVALRGGAAPSVPTVARLARAPADRAEAMAPVPVDEMARLCGDRRLAPGQSRRDAAEVGKRDVFEAALRGGLAARRHVDREARALLEDSEEDRLGAGVAREQSL